MQPSNSDFPTLLQLATLVFWLACVAVGVVGSAWHTSFMNTVPPLSVKQLTIAVSTDIPLTPDASPSPANPAVAPVALPPAPPALTTPSPAIDLAAPMPIVNIAAPSTVHIAVGLHPASAAALVHHLVLGQGEAQFIRLTYPEEAQLSDEEGSVGVQFTQGDDGHVSEAHLARPSRWPILNEAALKAVRQSPFPPGQPGSYDISFEFKLQ
jgi:periplasmic protein TonB